MPNHDRGQGLAASLVGAIETAQIRAVHVQHAQQPFAVQQRNDQFRTRCGIASNMTGKGFDIRYENGPALARGGAADASSQRNPNTGGLPLEWTEDQFFTSHKIEACPVQCGQAMKDRGCRVRGSASSASARSRYEADFSFATPGSIDQGAACVASCNGLSCGAPGLFTPAGLDGRFCLGGILHDSAQIADEGSAL
jgi:hypothetical protein